MGYYSGFISCYCVKICGIFMDNKNFKSPYCAMN